MPPPSPEEFARQGRRFRAYLVAAQTLFWLALFSVKFSFLMLYRTVFGTKGRGGYGGYAGKAFWAAVAYTLVSFGLCLVGVFAVCDGDASKLLDFGERALGSAVLVVDFALLMREIAECGSPYSLELQKKLVWVAFTFNVTSDLVGQCHHSSMLKCDPQTHTTHSRLTLPPSTHAVILLPMPLIWRPSTSTRQKLAASAIFGLAIITVAFEVVRSIKLFKVNTNLTNLYGYLELTISVLLCMLPPYRFLVSPAADKGGRRERRLLWSRITTLRSRPESSRGGDESLADAEERAGFKRSGSTGDVNEFDDSYEMDPVSARTECK